ncbi:MAG: hypothetical protein ACI3VQ_06680 [Faecousia sp.]
MENDKRLIDAETLSQEIESLRVTVSGRPATWDEAKSSVLWVIDEQKTVDAAEVMRCMWISVKGRLPEEDEKCIFFEIFMAMIPDETEKEGKL